MQRQAVYLLIIGLFIESVGYVIDKADFFSPIVRVLSPTYVDGMTAVRELRAGKTLTPLMQGFDGVVYLFKEEARRQNPAPVVDSITVTRVRPGQASLAFGVSGARPRLPLHIELSTGQQVEWSTEQVEDALASLKDRRLTYASIVVFLVGIGLQVVGFVVEQRRDGTEAARNSTSGNT